MPKPEPAADYGAFDTDARPADGKHFWIWTSPGGAEYRGHTFHDDEQAALKAGREWLSRQKIEPLRG
jgi:hypothetical protein